jgi:hypothetical protein
MSQDDIFAAALDAELFASDEGDGSGPSEAADDDAAVAAARGGGDDGDGRSGGKSNSSDDPFAALDDMEGEPEEQPQPQQQEQEQQQQQQRQEKASCSHPGYMFGLCIRCGAAKPEDGDGQGPSGSAAGDVRDRGAGAAARPPPSGGMRIKHLHARQALEASLARRARARCMAFWGQRMPILCLPRATVLLQSQS